MSSARAEVAIWQARDGDRVYYRFFGEDAPTVWLMDGPPAEDARAFARLACVVHVPGDHARLGRDA